MDTGVKFMLQALSRYPIAQLNACKRVERRWALQNFSDTIFLPIPFHSGERRNVLQEKRFSGFPVLEVNFL